MDVFAKTICTYDVIAIQEIRDVSQIALPALVNLVNADGYYWVVEFIVLLMVLEYVLSIQLSKVISEFIEYGLCAVSTDIPV